MDVLARAREDRDAGQRERSVERRSSEHQVHRARVVADQGRHRRDLDEAALPDDRHAVAGAFDLGQVVRREEHGPTIPARLRHERQELPLHERVEPGRRLVHHEKRLPAHEHLDDAHLLAIAARQLPHGDAGIQLETFRDRSPGTPRQPAERSQVVQQRRRVHLAEIARIAAQVGELPVHGVGLAPRVESQDAGAARARPDQPKEHPDRRGLPRAVRPEKPEDLALVDAGVEVDDPAALAIPACQAAQLDRLGHGTPRSERNSAVRVERRPLRLSRPPS